MRLNKRIILSILTLVLLFTLTGCSLLSNSNQNDKETTNNQTVRLGSYFYDDWGFYCSELVNSNRVIIGDDEMSARIKIYNNSSNDMVIYSNAFKIEAKYSNGTYKSCYNYSFDGQSSITVRAHSYQTVNLKGSISNIYASTWTVYYYELTIGRFYSKG